MVNSTNVFTASPDRISDFPIAGCVLVAAGAARNMSRTPGTA